MQFHAFAQVPLLSALSGKSLFFKGSAYVINFSHSRQNFLFILFSYLMYFWEVVLNGLQIPLRINTKLPPKINISLFADNFRGYLGSLRSLPWTPDLKPLVFVHLFYFSVTHLGVVGRGQTVNKRLELAIYNFCVCKNLKIILVMLRKIQITVFILPV